MVNTTTSDTSHDGEVSFRFDGGSAWLNFAATISRAYSESPQERLHQPADLDSWLRQAGLHAPTATPADLTTARALRAVFRRVSEALVCGDQPALNDLTMLAESAALGTLSAIPHGIEFTSVRAALGAVALTALLAAYSPERTQLGQCHDGDCAWVFQDPSGRRQWCSTRCGNRARVRAHRSRNQSSAT